MKLKDTVRCLVDPLVIKLLPYGEIVMNNQFDTYAHLDPVNFKITTDELAEIVVKENYGLHRVLCSLVKAQERKFPDSKLASKLRKLVSEEVL